MDQDVELVMIEEGYVHSVPPDSKDAQTSQDVQAVNQEQAKST